MNPVTTWPKRVLLHCLDTHLRQSCKKKPTPKLNLSSFSNLFSVADLVPRSAPPHNKPPTLHRARNRVMALGAIDTATAMASREGGVMSCSSDARTGPSSLGHCSPSGPADLLVAIEGGVGPATAPGQAGLLECFAWVCIRDPHTGELRDNLGQVVSALHLVFSIVMDYAA